jgi:hypothetical protein
MGSLAYLSSWPFHLYLIVCPRVPLAHLSLSMATHGCTAHLIGEQAIRAEK